MVSFIVPVYNAEKYLSRCIDSLLAQTYIDYEIILVDDGSSDQSNQICNEYRQKDKKRIRVIHKENGGVSSARNVGLKEAVGDFVAFIDADDYVFPDYLETLLQKATENGADVICCDFQEIITDSLTIPNPPRVIRERTVKDSSELFSDILKQEEGYPFCVWSKLIKTEFAKKVSFKNLKFGEDHLYMFDIFSLCPVTHLTTYKGYCYAPNEGSVTVRIDASSVMRTADVLSMQRYKVQNLPSFAKECKDGFYNLYATALIGYINAALRYNGLQDDINFAKKEAKEIISSTALIGKGTKLKLTAFYLLPKTYAFLINLLKRKIR